ncbi:hypothetical protein PSACC_02368 [Paramicrosporidium saccamoebae]|uniref:Autophagy-related protein 16 domain-containing protein n=1 Tax=Paramicrosporidium saccamoebae TaxID=1246581 RepID=A0A2H9TJ95_9FUNG|nr:hypothetical protein PSACC_02368 [Paramicrosporidium saccamoebae]
MSVDLNLTPWLQSIGAQLDEQFQSEEAPFEALIAALASLREELESFRSDGDAMDSRKYQDLENKYRQTKSERMELLRTQSINSQKLLELSEQIKSHEFVREKLETEYQKVYVVTIYRIKSMQTASSDFGKKVTYYGSLVEEKNLNIQILQDELQALQLELLQTDERVKSLESENQQLVQRWLSKVSETVEKLNAEVESTSPEQKPSDKIIKQTSMNRQISGLTTRADIVIPHGEADTKGRILLFRGLESSQFLISPRPNDVIRTFISRDADLCIGIGNRDPDTAHIWSIDSGRLISNLSAGFGTPFIDLTAVSSTNDALVTLHNPNILRFYDLPRSFCMWTETLETFAMQLSPLSLSNADLVATLLADGRLYLWDIRHRRVALKSPHQLPKFTSVATAGSNIVACTDRAVHVLDPVNLRILRTITHPALAPCSACPRVAITDTRFAIAAKSKIIYGDYTTGTVESVLSNHQYDVTGVGWVTRDDEKCLFTSADVNGNLFLYDL